MIFNQNDMVYYPMCLPLTYSPTYPPIQLLFIYLPIYLYLLTYLPTYLPIFFTFVQPTFGKFGFFNSQKSCAHSIFQKHLAKMFGNAIMPLCCFPI
jgi:hypothetical protein